MLCGEYLHSQFGGDVARIPAQLLSGIGFIGAGTILTDGFNVKGLTTAASLLSVTCIGLSIGAGFYLGGIICTLVIYLILAYSHKTLGKLEHLRTVKFDILALNNKDIIPNIQALLDKYNFTVKKINKEHSENHKNIHIFINCKCKSSDNVSKVLSELSTLDNILEVEEE